MKKPILPKLLCLIAGLTLLVASPVVAGVVFEIETTDHGHSPPRLGSMQIQVQGRNLKMDIQPTVPGGRGGHVIFRGDRGEHGELVIVDHDQKSYFVLNDSSMGAMAGQLGAALGAAEEALKNLPKEQREMIEKMMKERGGLAGGLPGVSAKPKPKPKPKPEVRKTGERGTKLGYPCVKYEVLQGGKKVGEIWTTDWDNIDGGDEAADAFRGLSAFFMRIMDSMPSLPGGGELFGDKSPFDRMNFENGFPVVSEGFGDDGGDLESSSALKSAKRQRLDPAAFEPPQGYKRMAMGPP